MKFRPLHDRVVVRRIEAEEKSAGGIIIPDTGEGKAVAKARLSPVPLMALRKPALCGARARGGSPRQTRRSLQEQGSRGQCQSRETT